MNKSTKLIMTGAASLLGVALAAGGAYATSGSLTVSNAPGQVMKLGGVGPASTHASANAFAHANKEHARGLFGISTDQKTATDTETDTEAPEAKADTETDTDTDTDTDATVGSTPKTEASTPREAAKNASTAKGNGTGMTVKGWAQTKNDVEVVAPEAAVTVPPVKVETDVKADVQKDADR